MPKAEPEVEVTKTPITLTDGRVVEFNKKQKLIKTSSIDGDTITVVLDFRNGETRSIVLRADMILQFAAHGAEQKLGDVIAGENDIDDAVLAMDELITRLNAGEWTVRRERGAFAGMSILLRALVEATGKTPADIKAFLDSKSQAEKIAMRRSAKLKPIIDRLEAEKDSKKSSTIDTDALFDELTD